MAKNALELSITIAGKVDKSLDNALKTATRQVGGMATALSSAGKLGLAAMGAIGTAGVLAIGSCTKAASTFESQMGDVVKYVDGLADSAGKISDKMSNIGNGNTFAENYAKAKDAIQELSTQIPYTQEELTKLTAAAGQSGKKFEELFKFGKDGSVQGFVRDVAMMGTAMDIDAEQAGNWAAKWEEAFSMNHDQVMELADQINYLGANNATTAAEIGTLVNDSAGLGQIAGLTASTTAALGTAILAMGVNGEVASTTIRRMVTNMSLGETATKAQQTAWEKLGLTADGVAKSMQVDSAGTIISVFEKINALDADKQVGTLKSLFGQWAIEGAAKLTGNLQTFIDTLGMVQDPSLYNGSMMREFVIKSGTNESIDMMLASSKTALQEDIGDAFLPIKKEFSLLALDTLNGIREDLPGLTTSLTNMATSAMPILRSGVEAIGNAVQKALPYIQKAIDYVANNGDKVMKVIGGIAAAFTAMTFAPAGEKLLGGLGGLLTGTGSLLAGGGGKSGGLLGGIAGLFTGGQNAAGAAGGLISSTVAAGKGNGGILGALWGGTKNLLAGGGAAGTTELMKAAQANPGLLSMLPGLGNIVAQSKIGQAAGGYFGGIKAALGTAGNTKIGKGIQAVGGVSKEILAGILGPEGTNFSGLASGAVGAVKGGAGWLGGKVGSLGAMAANSGAGQAVGGFIGKAAPLAGGAVGNIGSFAGAGAGVLGSVIGPAAGGFASLFTGVAPVIAAISGVIAVVSILGDHFEDIRGIIGNVFGDTGLAVFDGFVSVVTGVKDKIVEAFSPESLAGVQETITNLFGPEAGAAFGGFTEILQSVMGVVGQVVDFATGTVKPIIEEIFNFITQTVMPGIMNIFAAAAPYISSIVKNLGTAVMTGMNMIGKAVELVLPFVEKLVEVFLNIAGVVVPALAEGFAVVTDTISKVMTDLMGIFTGLIDFVTGVFTGDWEKAWNGVVDIFRGIFNGIVDIVNGVIDTVTKVVGKIADAISNVISKADGLDKAQGQVDDAAANKGTGRSGVIGTGVGTGRNSVTVPKMATGGFTRGPSIAGEAGQEAVISFLPGARQANIGNWLKAGQMLGVAGNEVELKEFGNGKSSRTGSNGTDADSGAQFVYSPNITINGDADKADIESALHTSYEEFKQYLARYEREKRRTKY